VNVQFVDKDLKVVDQMQLTIAAPRATLAGERDHGDGKDTSAGESRGPSSQSLNAGQLPILIR
jgi:hypothetical protein